MWKLPSKASKIAFFCQISFLLTFLDCHDKSLTLGCVYGTEIEKLFMFLQRDTENLSNAFLFEGARLVHRNTSLSSELHAHVRSVRVVNAILHPVVSL